jgi:uncharacterized protein
MNNTNKSNRLIHEISPYLLQHAYNPVNWYPWGNEALKKASEENKLILVSIGYSACHWCHVMAHESFEDESVANLMNEYFVPVKVDREERPDIDYIYMEAVQMITGSGGWPLNCFALPDGTPVYGGTYFRKDNWIQLLTSISELYKTNPQQIIDQAFQLKEGIVQNFNFSEKSDNQTSFIDQDKVYKNISGRFDLTFGGLKPAPKFPMPVVFNYLLDYHYFNPDKNVLKHIKLTLDKMAQGGIYDQLGGGFARYSTDEKWFAPHFEKMLYDNAQLISLYSQVFRLTNIENYKIIVEESMDFITQNMLSPEDGFYSALDADSEGKEGTYYTWAYNEIENLLGNEADIICNQYGVTKEGNWEEGKNILSIHTTHEELSFSTKTSLMSISEKLIESKKTLLKERLKRIKPGLDNKIIASWNGLMIKGCVDAYKATGNRSFLDLASNCGNFIISELIENNKLKRIYKDIHQTEGFLDDYANVINAFLFLYEQTFEENWLFTAKQLTDYLIIHFYDKTSKLFFYQSDSMPFLITRKIVTDDNVTPSPNSVMAENLYLLSVYFENTDYLNRSKVMIESIGQYAMKYSSYYSNWARISQRIEHPSFEVAIVGENTDIKMKELNLKYHANIVLAGSMQNSSLPLLKDRFIKNKTLIYVCRNNTCKLPIEDIREAINLLKTE